MVQLLLRSRLPSFGAKTPKQEALPSLGAGGGLREGEGSRRLRPLFLIRADFQVVLKTGVHWDPKFQRWLSHGKMLGTPPVSPSSSQPPCPHLPASLVEGDSALPTPIQSSAQSYLLAPPPRRARDSPTGSPPRFPHHKHAVLLSSPQGVFDPAQAPLQKVIKRKYRQGEEKIALRQNKAKHCHPPGPLALPQELQRTSGGRAGAGGREAGAGWGLWPGLCNPLGCRAQLHSCPGLGQAPGRLGRATLQVWGPDTEQAQQKGLLRPLLFPTAHRGQGLAEGWEGDLPDIPEQLGYPECFYIPRGPQPIPHWPM